MDMQRIIAKHQHTDGLIALFPQHQMSGDISYDFGPNQGHGTLSNVSSRYSDHSVTRGHYMNASGYDGKLSSYNDIYTATLVADFDPEAGAIIAYIKTDAAWAELIDRYVIRLAADANNQIQIWKSSTAGKMYFAYESAGNNKLVAFEDLTTMDWFSVGMMWDKLVNDEVRMFLNGVDTDGGVDLDDWTGALTAATTVIGASENDGSDCWDGGLGIVAIYNTIKSDAEMLYLSKP